MRCFAQWNEARRNAKSARRAPYATEKGGAREPSGGVDGPVRPSWIENGLSISATDWIGGVGETKPATVASPIPEQCKTQHASE